MNKGGKSRFSNSPVAQEGKKLTSRGGGEIQKKGKGNLNGRTADLSVSIKGGRGSPRSPLRRNLSVRRSDRRGKRGGKKGVTSAPNKISVY